MRILFLFLIVNLFAFSCKVQDTRLNVCPRFAGLTSFDSGFVSHILSHDEHKKHCVLKTDSFILLTLKKKKFDRVYYLTHDGYIHYWMDIHRDTIIYSGRESE